MNPICLSSSWKSSTITRGEELLEAFKHFQIDGVELEYRIPLDVLTDALPRLRKAHPPVLSVHNYFPLPPRFPRSMAGGDLFLLSHPDRDHRQGAVNWTAKTMEWASELEARRIVLHCGKVAMDPQLEVLQSYHSRGLSQSDEAQVFIRQRMEERDRLKSPYLDSLMWSLDRLLRLADRYEILLCLENRSHYHELPGADDFRLLFDEFKGAPIAYWHDVGHAQLNENLGIQFGNGLLEANADRLAGIHFHDCKDLDDHLPPGRGQVDYSSIIPHIGDGIPCVLELRPGTPDSDVADGLAFVRELLSQRQTGESDRSRQTEA